MLGGVSSARWQPLAHQPRNMGMLSLYSLLRLTASPQRLPYRSARMILDCHAILPWARHASMTAKEGGGTGERRRTGDGQWAKTGGSDGRTGGKPVCR